MSPCRAACSWHHARTGQDLQIATACIHFAQRPRMAAWLLWSTSHRVGSWPRHAASGWYPAPSILTAAPRLSAVTVSPRLCRRRYGAAVWAVLRVEGVLGLAVRACISVSAEAGVLGRDACRSSAGAVTRIGRLVRRIKAAGGALRTAFRDRSCAAASRLRAI